jgi:cysteine desulfurase/selenocysteine lyase
MRASAARRFAPRRSNRELQPASVPVHLRRRGDIGCDFYVFSGHKMLGPMGTGVVWGRHELLEAMPPYHVGSNMAHDVDFERAALEHAALKFQAGTPDVAGPVGLAAAVRFLDAAGPLIRRHDDELVRHGLTRLAGIPHVRIIGPHQTDRRVPVFTFVVEGHAATFGRPHTGRAWHRRQGR